MSGHRWTLYHRLLEEVPEARRVERVLVGRAWTLVASEGVGMAMTHPDETAPAALRPPYEGRPLRELAAHVRSWNVREAAIGLAAINAGINQKDRVERRFGVRLPERNITKAFDAMADEVAGKKVAVIGHFPDLEPLAARCELTVLERRPQRGDLPDFAAEYVLAEQDCVFITGTTIVNKTLPRLLELCAGAKVVLVGPSVPLTPLWFELGVSVLAGTVAADPASVWQATAEGGVQDIWDRGAVTVQLRAEDCR
jgi:hypothetical protein